ncbi:hypothetical protein WJX73_001292 [Symbiochloris irregularis]|uniref:Lycopene beta cyclase n=1 Tax=Symbiochloris irregularis TaxID=706552 RepID=A0AAW1NRU0_9CHLO
MEAYWTAIRKPRQMPPPPVVRVRGRRLKSPVDYDVVVCGGTLGLFLALALQLRGCSVCVVERRRVEGRSQEWNISRHELQVLLDMQLVNAEELKAAIATEYNPARIAFHECFEMWIEDVLNLGIVPRTLLASMKARFLEAGGIIREHTSFNSAEVDNDGVAISLSLGADAEAITAADTNRPLATYPPADDAAPLPRSLRPASHPPPTHGSHDDDSAAAPSNGAGPRGAAQSSGAPAAGKQLEIRARLLVDCMGHWSPIVKQMRGVQRPEGMCLVVGGCTSGFTPTTNRRGDFLRTVTDAEDDMQLMWQAFPAAGGRDRTVYMFAYADADKRRPSIESMLDRYFELLPRVCGMPLDFLSFKRFLFAGLPSYGSSPLRPGFDRVLQVGDASSSSSPISFGGFGTMLRHLPRLTDGISSALQQDRLSRKHLMFLQPYQPSLSVSWLFQRAMSLRPGQLRAPQKRKGASRKGWLAPNHINKLLCCNFQVMQLLGEGVVRRFVQDTCQWGPLSLTMAAMLLRNPLLIMRVVAQVGPRMLFQWFGHYATLTLYAFMARVGPLLRRLPRLGQSWWLARMQEAWTYGAGLDWKGPKQGGAEDQPQRYPPAALQSGST